MSNSDRLKTVWNNMMGRCNRKSGQDYLYYGSRGISVCDEWRDYEAFRVWALNSGYDYDAPYGECTLDRIDFNGNYEPDNCRWVDIATQNRNRRPYTTSSMHNKRVPPVATGTMSPSETVSHFLYDWMTSSKATLIAVAKEVGVSPNTIAKKIQCISHWYFNEVVEVARITGCSLNELAGIREHT